MSRSAVTVYGRKSCPPCMRTKKLLEQGGVDLLYVDVDHEPDALVGLTDLEWITALPVVVCDELELRWCGYRPERIKELISVR